MADQLTEFMIESTRTQARTEQMLKDMNVRLFGGEGQQGALPYIMQEAKTSAKEAGERFGAVEGRTGALESWKKSSLAWIGGAVAIITLEGTLLAFYFNSIAGHIKTLAGR